MQKFFRTILPVLCVLSFLGDLYSQPDENGTWTEVKTSFLQFKKGATFRSANRDTVKSLTALLPLPNKKNDSGFTCEPSPGSLKIDPAGGSVPKKKVSNKGGVVTLSGVKFADGEVGKYAVNFVRKGRAWAYERACAMAGTVDGFKFLLVDDNSNGKYNEKGIDGFINLSGGNWVVPIGDVVKLGKKLYYVKINESGTTLKFQEYKGKAGLVDLSSGFKAKGKLDGIVINGKAGWFDVTEAGGHNVPVGEYRIFWGGVAKGKFYCTIGHGKLDPILVKENEKYEKVLGNKFTIVFTVSQNGSKITVNSSMFVRGQSGEEYVDFGPDKITPEILITEAGKKVPLAKGRFCLG